jgi:hypothetical protein
MIQPSAASIKPIQTDTAAFFATYPHLRCIELLWGSRECRDFIHQLMFKDDRGNRQGFPPVAASTILALLTEHDLRFPQCAKPQDESFWMDATHRTMRLL